MRKVRWIGLSLVLQPVRAAAGMTKINIATHLNATFTRAVRAALTDETKVDPRKYLGVGRDAVAGEAARLLALIGGPRVDRAV